MSRATGRHGRKRTKSLRVKQKLDRQKRMQHKTRISAKSYASGQVKRAFKHYGGYRKVQLR